MVSQISGSGPDNSDRDMPMTRCEDQSKIGHTSRKKNLRTEEGDDHENTVPARGKKVRMNTSFEAFVTALNLQEDVMHLPKDLTSSSGFKRKNSKIVITDGGERSREMNLRFNNTSDTFYITRGWRHFCVENGKNEGSFFTFELMRTGDTPLLSFCPTGSIIDRDQSNRERCGDSALENQKILVNLRFSYDSQKRCRLYLSLKFLRKNRLAQPRMVTLVGKDGTRTLANLVQETTGRMSLGMGWKEFTKANGFVVGDLVTLELYWKKGIPMLGLYSTESGCQRWQQGENSSKANERENNIGERSKSSPLNDNRLVTLALKPEDVKGCTLYIPSKFIRPNGMEKLGKITILGKKQMKCCGYLLSKDGTVAVECDWRIFCEANGVNVGDPFTLEFIDEEEDKTPVYKFSPSYSKT